MRIAVVALALLSALSLAGCEAVGHAFCAPNCGSQNHNSSSLVSFLYPDGKAPPQSNSIPQLRLPLRVGLAFLPSDGNFGAPALDAAHRNDLLERIRQHFSSQKFISDIVLVPDYYLTSKRGFVGLEGVQRLYNVDLMALVSYDQVTYMEDNKLSLAYITILGAYVVKGSSHDVTTLIDLAVVDPASRSLVLRAGGTDTRHGSSTLIDQSKTVRAADIDSYSTATDKMITNFDGALTQFEADVRTGKANVRVANQDGTAVGGGGAFDLFWLPVLLWLVCARLAQRPVSDAPLGSARSRV